MLLEAYKSQIQSGKKEETLFFRVHNEFILAEGGEDNLGPKEAGERWWVLLPYNPDENSHDQLYFYCNYKTGKVWRCDDKDGKPTTTFDYYKVLSDEKNKDDEELYAKTLIRKGKVKDFPSYDYLYFKYRDLIIALEQFPFHAYAFKDEIGFPVETESRNINDFNLVMPKLRIPTHTDYKYLEAQIPSFEDSVQDQRLGGTDDDLVGETLIPYFYINDYEKSRIEQVKETPLYKLSRKVFFECVKYISFEGNTGATIKRTYKTGMKKTDSEEMSKVSSWYIDATFGLTAGNRKSQTLKPIMGYFKLNGRYSEQLGVKVSHSEERLEESTLEISFSGEKGGSGSAIWLQGEIYELTRMGEDKPFKTWEAHNPNYVKYIGTVPDSSARVAE